MITETQGQTETAPGVVLQRRVRPTWWNVIFMLQLILPQIVAAALAHKLGLINAGILVLFLFLPCHDKQFGRGRPHFWVRQLCLKIAAIITAIIALA